MKMKLPDLSGKVIVIRSDKEEARKCYENSLKRKRGVVMVIEQPPVSDSQMELEPVQEATPAESTPARVMSIYLFTLNSFNHRLLDYNNK